jgi:SAM-dependent methyltransferase
MSTALYDRIGHGYAAHRRADPRLAARIDAALGSARTVLNVGAGSGSYEPVRARVVAAEPSAQMVGQRSARAAPAVQASAERLPFADGAFDACLAVLTVHHWAAAEEGLREMRRVARQRIVIVTWDPAHPGFWLTRDYFPEILRIDREIFPTIAEIRDTLGEIESTVLPVPHDCTDGFLGGYWRRPEFYLDEGARGAISTFARIDPRRGLASLAADLGSGAWRRRYRDLLGAHELDIGYRIVTAG